MVRFMSVVSPLYIYPANCTLQSNGLVTPGTYGCAYNKLFDAISTYKYMNFTVVLNPQASDQGTTPSANWVGVTSTLNKLDVPKGRVRKIGYCDSAFGWMPYSNFTSCVKNFASWGTQGPYSNITMDGIFVDDMANNYNTSNLNYYTQINSIIKSTMPNGHGFSMMNPGSPVDVHFYSVADNIITYEDTYQNINKPWGAFDTNTNSQYSNCPRQKQTFIAYNFTGSLGDQQQLSDTMGETNAMGMFFLTDQTIASNNNTGGPYGSFPTQWTAMVDAVNATDTWMAQHPASFPSKRSEEIEEEKVKRAIEWKA